MSVSDEDDALLDEVSQRELDLDRARVDFLRGAGDRREAIRRALRVVRRRRAALALAHWLDEDERKSLLPELLWLASVWHQDTDRVHDVVLTLPREWLAAHAEPAANELFAGEERGETYLRLLELFVRIDDELTCRVAQRAAADEDPDAREAGETFLASLRRRGVPC